MYKALLFDIDGVLLMHKKLFIDVISRELSKEAYTILHPGFKSEVRMEN